MQWVCSLNTVKYTQKEQSKQVYRKTRHIVLDVVNCGSQMRDTHLSRHSIEVIFWHTLNKDNKVINNILM